MVIVGHIPKIMYKLTYFFLKHGGHIKYEINSVKKYSKKKKKKKKKTSVLEIVATVTISNANKRVADVMKEKMNSQEYKKLNSKPK